MGDHMTTSKVERTPEPWWLNFYWDNAAQLKLDEVWPDGDTPSERPTVDDVVGLLDELFGGSVERLLREWDLFPDQIEIVVDGERRDWGRGW